MSSADFQRLPGFRDFAPEDLHLREHIFAAWRSVARRYGFLEYDAPPLESLGLYVEKSGEEIVQQLYAFEDKGGRNVALRPEMTPSLARMLAERSKGMAKPIRWFSIPQLFRYERQQRGRLREHFQWNVDIVGEGSYLADVEVLAVAIDALRSLGLGEEDIHARVSDRRLLTAVLTALGVADAYQPAAFAVIDKIEREERDRSRARLEEEAGLDRPTADRLLELFDGSLEDGFTRWRTLFGNDERVAERLDEVDEYVAAFEAMELGNFVSPDPRIVRGLAYYTGIVFEIFDRKGEFRAICGGGRYDRLLERVGGEPLPAVGFGMGDVVLGELLKDRERVPEYRRAIDIFLVIVDDSLRSSALRLAHALREKGASVSYSLRSAGVRKQFTHASREGAAHVVILGPDEMERGMVVVRDMESGTEREVSLEVLVEEGLGAVGR